MSLQAKGKNATQQSYLVPKKDYSALYPGQTGFRTGLGTQDSLLIFARDVTFKPTLRRGELHIFIVMDVKKVFDSVPHCAVIQEAQPWGLTAQGSRLHEEIPQKPQIYSPDRALPRRTTVKQGGAETGLCLVPTALQPGMTRLSGKLHQLPNLKFTI